jgi:hypothetical protein
MLGGEAGEKGEPEKEGRKGEPISERWIFSGNCYANYHLRELDFASPSSRNITIQLLLMPSVSAATCRKIIQNQEFQRTSFPLY